MFFIIKAALVFHEVTFNYKSCFPSIKINYFSLLRNHKDKLMVFEFNNFFKQLTL